MLKVNLIPRSRRCGIVHSMQIMETIQNVQIYFRGLHAVEVKARTRDIVGNLSSDSFLVY